jgi:hypothetical protein
MQKISFSELNIIAFIYLLDVQDSLLKPEDLYILNESLKLVSQDTEKFVEELIVYCQAEDVLEKCHDSIIQKLIAADLSNYSKVRSLDLVGLGSIVGHLKDILFRFIDLHIQKSKIQIEKESLLLDNHKKLLENESLALENQRKRLENESLLRRVLKEYGYSDDELRMLSEIPRKSLPDSD